MANQITLQLEPGPYAPRMSRSRLKELQDYLEPKYNDVAIVVTELVTNSVKHGNGAQEIWVEVMADNERIRVVVRDDGPCFTKGTTHPDGWGLEIVDRIAETWEVMEDDGCQVRVEISRAS